MKPALMPEPSTRFWNTDRYKQIPKPACLYGTRALSFYIMWNVLPAYRSLLKLALFLAPLLCALPADAQTRYRVDRELSFGMFGVRNNHAIYELTVDVNGAFTADPPIVSAAPFPTNGEIFLDGLDPNMPFNVTFDPGTLTLNGSGLQPYLYVVDFTTNGPFTTSASGTLLVLTGATLRTSGNMDPYPSGPYSGTYNITFDY